MNRFLLTRGKRWTVVLLALAVLLAGLRSVQADNLDLQLAYMANRIVPMLEKKGYKNVGVLHFRVQREGSKESFNLGSLSENLAMRVENALVIGCNAQKPLGVIRDASAVAAAKKVGWYHDEEARKKLFGFDYPLAWGKTTVKPDAFLTGVVKISRNQEEATLVLEVFDRHNLRLTTLREIEFAADRSLLADMGQTFAAGKRGLKAADRDKVAIRDARKRDVGEATNEAASPGDVGGFMLEVKYGPDKQEIRKDPDSKGEWRLQPPLPGMPVSIVLTNLGKGDRRLACVCKVNGKSLYQQQDDESKYCQMWVFGPSEVQEFKGYYIDLAGNNLLPFKVLTEEESKEHEAEFGSKVGLIELDVFESRPVEGEGEPMLISLRSVSRRDLARKPATARDLQERLKAKWPATVKLPAPPPPGARDSLIVPEADAVEGGPIQNAAFPSPAWVDHIVIRYYNPAVEKLISN